MSIESLELRDFRNIQEINLRPAPGFNVIWWDNAQGKTNLLEAVYLLGHLKSFRSGRNEELITQGRTAARLKASLTCQKVQRAVEMTIAPTGKKALVNGKNVRTAGHFFGFLRPVLFSPEEVGLVKGVPAGRRALLDRAIFQVDPAYLEKAQEYERCLRQRNRLLREGARPAELEPWDEALVRLGARIRRERQTYLQRIVPLLQETYSRIAGQGEKATLEYPAAAADEESQRENLRRQLAKHGERERLLGQTLVGPHRDDPLFLVQGRPLRLYGSQGQQRTFMLAFKTAQIMDLEKRTGEPPVLLLDDMTSELDRQRQGFFFRFLLARKGQVFITTTDVQTLISEGLGQARFYRVKAGTLLEDCRE